MNNSEDKNLIRVYDGYGQEFFITREQWRNDILLANIKKNWDQPDDLYNLILSALNDGFCSDVVNAAERLYKIDPTLVRGACIWGIVLMEDGRLDDAEKIFRDFISKNGDNGVILTNLAKIYARRKDDSKAEEILWHALEIDPNQDNGMGWYEAIHREKGGEVSSIEALKRIAALEGSWRAQLWLARAELKLGHLEQALDYYRESLSRVGKNIPHDLLMQMSGDLGQHDYPQKSLEFTEPLFVAETHGLQVGNNLIKAHLDLGHIEAAHRIVNQLYTLKRPDWNSTLGYWETEIAKKHIANKTVTDKNKPLKGGMLVIEEAVWMKPSPLVTKLFPPNPQNNPVICFLGGSVETATKSDHIQHRLSDADGRLSRALPLFLAEQVYFNSLARVETLTPWIADKIDGFLLNGWPWANEDAVSYARQSPLKGDYIVVTHLRAQSKLWSTELRLIRVHDGKCLGKLGASFLQDNQSDALSTLAQRLIALLREQSDLKSRVPPPFYQVPEASHFPLYLLLLEQLLAVRCTAREGGFLKGEREIILGNLQLCLFCPENMITRLLLAQTLLEIKKVRPDILSEFNDKIKLLQKEKPLPDPVHEVIQCLFDEALG